MGIYDDYAIDGLTEENEQLKKERDALRAALERGRKQLEHINNYWLDTLTPDVISADGVDQVKEAIEHAITELNIE